MRIHERTIAGFGRRVKLRKPSKFSWQPCNLDPIEFTVGEKLTVNFDAGATSKEHEASLLSWSPFSFRDNNARRGGYDTISVSGRLVAS